MKHNAPVHQQTSSVLCQVTTNRVEQTVAALAKAKVVEDDVHVANGGEANKRVVCDCAGRESEAFECFCCCSSATKPGPSPADTADGRVADGCDHRPYLRVYQTIV